MSDNWIILIPSRPDYVPDPHAQEEARVLLAELLSRAKVTASVSPQDEYFLVDSVNPKVQGMDGAVRSFVEYLYALAESR